MTTARGHMWLGPRGYETWVPACTVSPDFSRSNFATSTGYLNGGAGVSTSKGSARHYTMTWGARPRNEMRAITDIASGLFDSQNGVNLVYFNDPMTYDTNMAPEHLGNPALAAEGAPGIFGWDSVPSVSATGANPYGYPARTAVYSADRASTPSYFPIPPGFTAWIGAHGAATGAAGVRVTPALGLGDGTPALLTMLGTATPTLVNYSIPAGNGVTGFTLDFPQTGLGRNFMPNPSVETDLANISSAPGTGGAATLTRVAATSSSLGSWAARLTYTKANTAASSGRIYEAMPVTAGQVLSFGVRARASVATSVRAVVTWLDAANNIVGAQVVGASTTLTAGAAWSAAPELQVLGATVPRGAVTAWLAMQSVSSTYNIGDYLEADGFHSNSGSTLLAYADGNTAGWQWDGLVNDSSSRQTADILALTGIVIQMLPTGQSPTPGRYISGQGNAGCQFEKRPTETPYNAKIPDGQGGLGLMAMSANLIETGPWL